MRMKKTNRTSSCLLDRTRKTKLEGFGKASRIFGEYRSLGQSNEFLGGKDPGSQKFWTAYSKKKKKKDVTVLEHLKEAL